MLGVYDHYSSQYKLTAPGTEAESFILDMLMPDYLAAIAARISDAAQAEDRVREARRPAVIEVLVSELANTADSWMKTSNGDKPDKNAALSLCQPAAERIFSDYFRRVGADQGLPTHFEAFENLRNQWGSEACRKAVATPAVNRQISRPFWQSVTDIFTGGGD